tara:strand:+ start:1054 stop:1680 length:627 start_codon:yes stop_codon:yes gene_type:complete
MKKHIFYDLWCATDKVHGIKIEYDKTKKIKDQILFEHGHVKLLNVSKSYSNDVYQGVWFLLLVDTDFLKLFEPVDLGFDEALADDLDSLILNKYFLKTINDLNESIDYDRTTTVKSFNFLSNNKTVNCKKIYVEGNYAFTNYYTDTIVQRGAYSDIPIFSSSNFIHNFQCDGNDNNCIINYYNNKSVPNLANTITLTSTAYSTITYDI